MEKTLVHLFHSLPRQDCSLQNKGTGQSLVLPTLTCALKGLEPCCRNWMHLLRFNLFPLLWFLFFFCLSDIIWQRAFFLCAHQHLKEAWAWTGVEHARLLGTLMSVANPLPTDWVIRNCHTWQKWPIIGSDWFLPSNSATGITDF